MTKKLLLLVSAAIFGINLSINAQCTPGNATSCPDPENNGQICPDSLPDAYKNTPYSVDITILPPPSVAYMSTTVPLNKIVLLDVGNLPPGLTWVSNSATNTFFPLNYYCVLLSGTPSDTGFFQLKIKVAVYITFLGNPLYVGESIDSTSVSIRVSLITGREQSHATIQDDFLVSPNPFIGHTSFSFYSAQASEASLEIFDLTGNRLYYTQTRLKTGQNTIPLDANSFMPGMYIYRITSPQGIRSGRMTKIN